MASRSIQKKVKQIMTEDGAKEVEYGDDAGFEPIDKLQDLGMNVADIKKLKEAGIYTVGYVLKTSRKRMALIKGFSDAKVEKVFELAMKMMPTGFMTGLEALERRKSIMHVTTGSKQLDDLLGGGIETRQITEVCGEFRTGKTQLCHTLGGGQGKVMYLDLEGTFRPSRVQRIAERWNLDPSAVLENISIARVYTTDEQIRMVQAIAERLVEEEHAYRVVIIDSITSAFRVEYQGRGELCERQQRLAAHLSALAKLADEFNLAVFVVNQVTAEPSGMNTMVADPKKPIGGHILAHACSTRLMLRKGAGNLRICKLTDSPCLAESEATFALADDGVTDE